MKKELLLASIASLVSLNQGRVEAAVPFNLPITVSGSAAPPPTTVVTVSESGVSCTANPVNYSGPAAINTAFRAIRSDFSKTYDVQICPNPTTTFTGSIVGTTLTVNSGTVSVGQVITGNGASTRPTTFITAAGTAAGTYTIYPSQTVGAGSMTAMTPYSAAGYAVFNGTIEGMGSAQYGQDVSILENCPGCQAYLLVGDATAAYPGVTMEIKNIQIDGTTNGNPAKGARGYQLVAGGYVRFDNDSMINLQDGVLANRWSEYAQDGSGVVIVSGSYFDNMCSANGPSHNVYLSFGTVVVGGGVATVVGGVPTPGTGSYVINGQTISVTGNSFGSCQYGYGTKVRPREIAYVEGNTYHMNFVNMVASSGAIQDGEGATLVATGNYIELGPFTGEGAQPPQIISVGGLLGENDPQSYTISNNTIVAQGITTLATIVASLNWTTNINISNNVLPLKNQIVAGGPLLGLGTIAAGNVYADNSPVAQAVQDTNFYIMTVPAGDDFRGTTGPKSVTLSGLQHASWGGNGLLTAAFASGGGNLTNAVLGGPGGITVNAAPVTNAWIFDDVTSPANTFNIGGANSTYTIFAYGTNDIMNGTSGACPTGQPPINIFQGGTFTLNLTNPIGTVKCNVYDMGGDYIFHSGTGGTGYASAVAAWPGSVVTEDGVDGYPNWEGQNATFVSNGMTIMSGTFAPEVFTFEFDGGWITGNPNPGVQGQYRLSTFDNGPGGVGTYHLKGSVSQSYAIAAYGGAVIYPGVNSFNVSGNSRNSGTPSLPITAHVESTPSTSVVNSGFGGLNLYLDGPGSLKANSANTNTQPTYVEVDQFGSGFLEVQRLWSPTRDSCQISSGVTTVSSGRVGSNWVMTFSNSGTVQFDGAASVSCSGGGGGSQSINSIQMSCGSSCTFNSGTVGAIVGNVQAGLVPSSPAFSGTWAIVNSGTDSTPAHTPCNSAGTTDFQLSIDGGAITTAASLAVGAYQNICVQATQGGLTGSPFTQAFTFTAVAPPPTFGTCFNGVLNNIPAPPSGTIDLNGYGRAFCNVTASSDTVLQSSSGSSLNVTGSSDHVFGDYTASGAFGHGRYALAGNSNTAIVGVTASGSTTQTSGAGNIDLTGTNNAIEFANTFASYHGNVTGTTVYAIGNGGSWTWKVDGQADQGATNPLTYNVYPVLTSTVSGVGFGCSPAALAACVSANLQLTNSGTAGFHNLAQTGTVLPGNGPVIYFGDCGNSNNNTLSGMFGGSGSGTYATPSLPSVPSGEPSPISVTASISGSTLNVSSISTAGGVIAPGMVITSGSGVTLNTHYVTGYSGGSSGGTGAYTLESAPGNVGSETMQLSDGPPTAALVNNQPQISWLGPSTLNIYQHNALGASYDWIPQLPIVMDAFDFANGNPNVTVSFQLANGSFLGQSNPAVLTGTQASNGVNEQIVSLHYVPPASCNGALCPLANTDTVTATFTNSHGFSTTQTRTIITWLGAVCPAGSSGTGVAFSGESQAFFTGAISSTGTLTVSTSPTKGGSPASIAPGQWVWWGVNADGSVASVNNPAKITSQLSGTTGGIGTYAITDATHTAVSQSMETAGSTVTAPTGSSTWTINGYGSGGWGAYNIANVTATGLTIINNSPNALNVLNGNANTLNTKNPIATFGGSQGHAQAVINGNGNTTSLNTGGQNVVVNGTGNNIWAASIVAELQRPNNIFIGTTNGLFWRWAGIGPGGATTYGFQGESFLDPAGLNPDTVTIAPYIQGTYTGWTPCVSSTNNPACASLASYDPFTPATPNVAGWHIYCITNSGCNVNNPYHLFLDCTGAINNLSSFLNNPNIISGLPAPVPAPPPSNPNPAVTWSSGITPDLGPANLSYPGPRLYYTANNNLAGFISWGNGFLNVFDPWQIATGGTATTTVQLAIKFGSFRGGSNCTAAGYNACHTYGPGTSQAVHELLVSATMSTTPAASGPQADQLQATISNSGGGSYTVVWPISVQQNTGICQTPVP